MFEDAASRNVRKYQCFVCGVNHNDLPSMKDHVIAKHEEGREYIKCPYCEYPVRDLSTHIKVKHPKRIMPKNVQTKVAVWRDFKPNGEKKATKAPTFRTGKFSSLKTGCDLTYRSGLECEFYELLEADNDVIGFFAEPFKVPYYYIKDGIGEWHDYIPDLRINFKDGTTEIWEIKPSSQTHYDQNKAKWGAMHDHALNHGWEFIVQTEVGLGQLKKKINKQKNLE